MIKFNVELARYRPRIFRHLPQDVVFPLNIGLIMPIG
jgi:hypothetical protein